MRSGLGACVALLCAVGIVHAAADRIVIPAKINGKPVRLALDTGAQYHVLFRRTADRLGLKVTPPPADAKPRPGLVTGGQAEPCRLEIEGQSAEMHFVVVTVPDPLRMQVDGVLSWRGYANTIVGIRWDEKTAGILAEVPPAARQWIKAPVRPNDWMLGITVTDADGTQRAVYIDTGSPSGVALSARRWTQWLADHPDEPATLDAMYTPGHGLVVSEVRWAKQLAFGPVVLRGVPIRKVEPALEELLPALEGVLGLFALTRLDVILDGKGQCAYLHPNAEAKSSYDYNRLGAVFVPRDMDSQDLLAHVLDGSPAHRAGIRTGDILLKVDELDATRWRTDPQVLPLARFWTSPAGTRVRLGLRRGGQHLEATAELADILGSGRDAQPDESRRP